MTEFISRKYGLDGFEIIIKTDCYDTYKKTENFARMLIDHAKPDYEDENFVTDNDDGCKTEMLSRYWVYESIRMGREILSYSRCPECGGSVDGYVHYLYCPYCGFKMKR